MKHCPKCKKDFDPIHTFCNKCSGPLLDGCACQQQDIQAKICPSCLKSNEPANTWCKYCGADLPQTTDTGASDASDSSQEATDSARYEAPKDADEEKEETHSSEKTADQAKQEIPPLEEETKQKNKGARSSEEKAPSEKAPDSANDKKTNEKVVLNARKEKKGLAGNNIKVFGALVLFIILVIASFFVYRSLLGTKKPDTGQEPPVAHQKLLLKSAFLKSADASGRPSHDLGYYPTIDSGQKKLFYFFSFQGAAPTETKLTARWFKNGSQIYENKTLTASAATGEGWSAIDYNFQTGNYMVKLYADGEELNTTWFNVGPSDGAQPPAPSAEEIKLTDDEYRQFIARSPEYKKADSALGEAYSRLRAALPAYQRDTLTEQQRQWIETRDRTAFEAGPKGSPGYMSALIQATNDRKNVLLRDIPKPRPKPGPAPPDNKPDTSDMMSEMERDLRKALGK